MRNKIIVGSLVLVIFVFLFVSLFRDSYATVEEDRLELEIYDSKNKEILMDDMKKIIDLVDGDIIVNSSFNLSSVLNENYDFLTKFVISFVLNNEEYFDIIIGDDYLYVDELGREYVTNKYIDINLLYEITYKVFGVEYYYILDDDLVVDNKLILIDMDNNDFDMNIDEITNIINGNGYYDVYVKYSDYDINYVYRFDILSDNRLVISNLSIGE